MLILASSVYASFKPGFNVISVPYMFDDQAQLLDYLNSETGDALMKSVDASESLQSESGPDRFERSQTPKSRSTARMI